MTVFIISECAKRTNLKHNMNVSMTDKITLFISELMTF